jgi:hypothetical protein
VWAVGKGNSETDWNIVPTAHAGQFDAGFAGFAAILRGSRIEGLATMYEELNTKAVSARDCFKTTVARGDTAVFCTAALGALLLIAGGLQQPLGGIGRWIIGAIGLPGVVAGGLAAMWLGRIKAGDLARKRMGERARVEAKRLAYFKAVMQDATKAPSDQILAFEYTRRFLLDNQIDYFRDRGNQHQEAADAALTKSSMAVFVVSALTSIAGLLAMWHAQLAMIARLGVLASAYAALAASRSAVNLDRRNASLYRAAEEQLKERRLDLDVYRAQTASGDPGAVQEFYERVFVVLEAEHKAFLSNAEQGELAIGKIEECLDAAKEALKRRLPGDAEDL